MNQDNVCYKCHKPGHFARECKQTIDSDNSSKRAGGGSSNRYSDRDFGVSRTFRANYGTGSGGFRGGNGERRGGPPSRCYRCNKNGHFARHCKEASERCYRCNQSGHLAKDCDNEVESGSCYNCGQSGHLQRDCKQSSNKTCFKCRETGHMARDCPNESVDGFSERKGNISNNSANDDRTCYNCGKGGHISRDCPESGLNRERDVCYRCNQPGHMSRNCTQMSNTKCYNCGGMGHIASKCELPSD